MKHGSKTGQATSVENLVPKLCLGTLGRKLCFTSP
jgi:hypothetical protein